MSKNLTITSRVDAALRIIEDGASVAVVALPVWLSTHSAEATYSAAVATPVAKGLLASLLSGGYSSGILKVLSFLHRASAAAAVAEASVPVPAVVSTHAVAAPAEPKAIVPDTSAADAAFAALSAPAADPAPVAEAAPATVTPTA